MAQHPRGSVHIGDDMRGASRDMDVLYRNVSVVIPRHECTLLRDVRSLQETFLESSRATARDGRAIGVTCVFVRRAATCPSVAPFLKSGNDFDYDIDSRFREMVHDDLTFFPQFRIFLPGSVSRFRKSGSSSILAARSEAGKFTEVGS